MICSKPVFFLSSEYQSTPAAQKTRISRKSDSLAAISPIFPENSKQHLPNLTQSVDKFVDIEIEDIPVLLREPVPKSATRASNPTGIDAEFREKERQSLANFEEFESTLLILENNKTEEEFDDLLNSFSANIRNPMSQKVRQSLDNIKKRHSSIGVEKQQQDELNREKTINTTKSGKYSDIGGHEKNRMNDTFGRTAMISSTSSNCSGNGERLLRRSRLFDDVMILDNGDIDHGGYMDNKQTAELNATQTLNRKNQQHLENDSLKTENTTINYNMEEISAENKANNRDRFKTIRIFKRPPENAVQIPDPDDGRMHEMQTPLPNARTVDAFATKNINSPKRTEFNDESNHIAPKAINTMTFKRSGLQRPRQLSGLVRRDAYAKSSSHELLSSDEQKTQAKPVLQLKSPMGIKSKSIHNLSTTKHSIKSSAGRPEYEQPSGGRNQPLVSAQLMPSN